MADNTTSGADSDGPTQTVCKRVKERKHYTEDCLQDEEIEGRRMFSVEEKLLTEDFAFDFVMEMKGEDFNYKFLQESGFVNPILFKDKAGLGMRMPSFNFTVNDVRQCVGSRRMLDVMDVTTQKDIEMTMKDWCRYFENENRDKLLNVISLEFSHTKLENYVESPTVVRQIDWVDWVWPRHLKESQTDGTNSLEDMKYPKVQKYCLMSVKGCYTDFHIDFGGTSVWYHILRGKKIFWLIPPTEKNVSLYEQWVLSGKQGDVFFGDTVDKCARVQLDAGNTFLIPTGWIHAVYTPEDSLVFGGNFLHNFGIEKQLRIAEVEDLTHVPGKFRYPFYTEILWYVVQRFVQCLMGKNYLSCNEDGDPVANMPAQKQSVDAVGSPGSKTDPNFGSVPSPTSVSHSNCETSVDASNQNAVSQPATTGQVKSPFSGSDVSREPLKPLNFFANMELNSSTENVSVKNLPKEHIHLTELEYNGLKAILKWLLALPSSKKSIPEIIHDPDGLLEDLKALLEEHKEDLQPMASTGKPVLFWSEIRKPKSKPRAGPTSSSSTKGSKSGSSKNNNNARRRRTRCKKCEACLRADCGDCHFCKDMKKFGGPGRMKQSCISRQCMAPVLPHTACCMLCGRDGWDKLTNPPENENSSLMECSQCWEILHPKCLQEKNPDLPVEGCLNDDLPNSWECPKCCRHGKPDQIKPRQMKGKISKGSDIRVSCSEYGPSNGEHANDGFGGFEQTSVKMEMGQQQHSAESEDNPFDSEPLDLGPDKKRIKTEFSGVVNPEIYDNVPNGCLPDNLVAPTDFSKAFSNSASSILEEANRETFPPKEAAATSKEDVPKPAAEQQVRPSCGARYPLMWKKAFRGDDKVLSVSNANDSNKLDFRSRPRVLPSGLAYRKQHGTARERLFRSMKGLKKNSELIRQGVLRVKTHHAASLANKFEDSSSYKLKFMKPGALNQLRKLKNSVSGAAPLRNGGGPVSQRDVNLVTKKDDEKSPPPSQAQKLSSMLKDSPNLKKPPFVVRPAPIVEDISEEEKNRNSRTGADNLAVEKEVMLPVFRFLSVADLYNCQLVCKCWNRWSVDPRLWTTMDLTRRKVTANVLIGIVRRQPVMLNLSWTNLSRRQLAWLVARLPQMKELVLAGCSAATVGALCTCHCPLLRSLDLSWVEGLTDSVIRDLLAPPADSRPGFVENKTRLRHLNEVKLAGADISDVSVRLLAHHLPLLSRLDLSHCHKVTDMGIAVLGAAKSTRLNSLDASSCSNITDTSLEALKRCTSLTRLDLRDCNQVTELACAKFACHNRQTLCLKDGKLLQSN